MHPGLYQYHDSVYINKRFATLEQQLIKPMSEEAFFRLLNPLVVDIRDGHTKWHRDQRPDDLFAFHQDGLFPLKLYFKDKKAYVVDGYGNNTVPQGSEVVSINGKTMVAIGNQTGRPGDRRWIHRSCPVPGVERSLCWILRRVSWKKPPRCYWVQGKSQMVQREDRYVAGSNL